VIYACTSDTAEISANFFEARSSEQTAWLALLQCASPGPDLDRLVSFVQHPFSWPVFLQGAEEHRVVRLACCARKAFGSCTDSARGSRQTAELQLAQAFFTLELTAELFRLLEHFANASIQVFDHQRPGIGRTLLR